ncbi:hypothetical protein FHU38_005328 [Saccharomonospora amisosensis]|uniref:Uncharacterized protein n=1 Tax=Saccharomonospora amisosensis TaxID=1128677 RepID=A0A7X5ZU24_9PSEU|nr:hypothetical protein [Saccharomonospora amisosensis]NIJ14920.1 hypothetical protein [Saccharomonospora amisosensis]
MDEGELRQLFREAPGEPPEPTFTAQDVVTASRRTTARRRAAVAGVAAAVVLVAGVGGTVGVLLGDGSGSETGTLSPALAPEQGQPGEGRARPPSIEGFPGVSPKQGGEAGEDGPRADSTGRCEKVDRELAAALAGELPIGAAEQASTSPVCPAGSRAAAYRVEEGTVSVVLVAPGVAPQLPRQPRGTAIAERDSPQGGTLLVVSIPAQESTVAPFADQLERVAAALAARF